MTFDTVLLSDIHLGSKVSRSADCLRVLRKIKCKRLIIVGDAFSGGSLIDLSDDDRALLKHLMHREGVIWISGNHDAPLLTPLEELGILFQIEFTWTWNGKKCTAIHGDLFDNGLIRHKKFAKIVSDLFVKVQHISALRQLISTILFSLEIRGCISKIAVDAMEYARNHGADIIFCGHTHAAQHIERWGVRYYNTGCWTGSRASFIGMTEDTISIHYVNLPA